MVGHPAELPVSDAGNADHRICTPLADAVAIAALYQCILHMLYRLRRRTSAGARRPDAVEENRWRAKRYGIDGGLIDFGKGSVVSFAD